MKQIATALVKAQREFSPALKCSTNPHFKSRYADLAACLEAVQDPLNNNGIALLQVTHDDATGVTVETLFIHESGEQISGGKLHVPASKQDPQGYGSALTYARRYSLLAACGIAPEDDDGNAAKAPPQPPKQKPITQTDIDAFAQTDFDSMESLKDVYAKLYKRANSNEQKTELASITETYQLFKQALEK
jgi:hypothetical protein